MASSRDNQRADTFSRLSTQPPSHPSLSPSTKAPLPTTAALLRDHALNIEPPTQDNRRLPQGTNTVPTQTSESAQEEVAGLSLPPRHYGHFARSRLIDDRRKRYRPTVYRDRQF
ncbi:ATP-NAD kinase PpnK-type alpha/beta [Penicillium expansum]|nr:ATP-NAD kinase PpnK-type alpha/beta [Penicillium expansum]